jgi:hypothetical protein
VGQMTENSIFFDFENASFYLRPSRVFVGLYGFS